MKTSGVKDANGKLAGVKDANGKLKSMDAKDWMLPDKDWLEVELSSPQTANHLMVVAETQQGFSKIEVSPGWLQGRGPEKSTTGLNCQLDRNIVIQNVKFSSFFSNNQFEGEEKDLKKYLDVSSRTKAFLVPLEGWPDIDFVKLEAINGVTIKIIDVA